MPEVVIDTNALLDWLLFDHPAGAALGQAVVAGRLCWTATQPMLDELFEVIDRFGPAAPKPRWPERCAPARAMGQRWHRLVDLPPPLPHPMRLRCTDADDQGFIDLALSRRTPWLISRDRAVLRLRRRAGVHGTCICTPEQWLGFQSTTAP